MKQKDFIHLDVQFSIESAKRIFRPEPGAIERAVAVAETCAKTEIEFLRSHGLIKPTSQAYTAPIEKVVLRLSDLSEEGQDFVMSGATHKWLVACDRKSNDMLKKGVSNEERLVVYADPEGLIKRLEKFRSQRGEKARKM